MSDASRYRFGPFLLEPALRRLLRDSSEITLPPKAFDILVLLVRTRDRVLSRRELLNSVWQDTAVIENTLTQRIREIREALGDDTREPRYVRTVSRVGYRFIADVVEETVPERPDIGGETARVPASTSISEDAPLPPVPGEVTPESSARARSGDMALGRSSELLSDRSAAEPRLVSEPQAGGTSRLRRVGAPQGVRRAGYAAVMIVVLGGLALWLGAKRVTPADDGDHRIESIAVLPLENLSHDAGQEYFADGMTDELIKELAGIRALRVISRTSALRYKGSTKSVREIGRELNVDAVVEGSVLRAGRQARITLKLVEVSTDRTLLAESFARDMEDILALQSGIARTLANRVRATVEAGDEARVTRRIVPQTYDDYLRARSLWNTRTREGVTKALELFHRAIDRDPTFAAAWAGVADCYITWSGALLGLSEKEAYPKAREAVLRALALDDTLAEAHTALGSIKNEFDWDSAGAEASYTRAIALNSNYVTARQWYGEFLTVHGRRDESIVQLRRARDLDPLSPVVNNSLTIALLLARRYDEALTQAQRTLDIEPDFGAGYLTLGSVHMLQGGHVDAIAAFQRAVVLMPGVSRATAWLGHAYAVAGQTSRARQTLAELQTLSARMPASAYDIALIHAALGEHDLALASLEQAYRERAFQLVELKVDPRFDSLRGDAKFVELLRRTGVPRQQPDTAR